LWRILTRWNRGWEVFVSNFQVPVSLYMSSPVHTVGEDQSLPVVAARRPALGVSSRAGV
jgi:hypothetical protein